MFAPGSEERLQYVRVTNNLPFTFMDRHDGVPVTIKPGKSENLPPDMAAHFFGYHPGATRAVMLRHTAKRHGWNTPEFVKIDETTHKTKADEWFDLIDIKAVMYKLVPAEDVDPAVPVPADPDILREETSDVIAREVDVKKDPSKGGRIAASERPRMVPRRETVQVSGGAEVENGA